MRRRSALRAIGVSLTVGVAGCMTSPLSRSTETATPTPRPAPTVSWTETWLGGERYRLRLTVQLNGADRVLVQRGQNNTLAELTQDGQYTIAGNETARGPVTFGQSVRVVRPRSGQSVDQLVSMHAVGSQEEPSIPTHLYGLSGSTGPDNSIDGQYSRTYTQRVARRRTTLTTAIPKLYYEYYTARYRTRDWGGYVSDRYDDPYLGSLASSIESYGERNNLSSRQIVQHAIRFVQNLEYTQDKATTGYNEYPKYPVETLVDRGGDCEDTCILLSSLLRELGYGSVLLVLPEANHMAVGVAGESSIEGAYYEYDGRRYYYLETTNGGWDVGEVPPAVQQSGSGARIREVDSRPVLVFAYQVFPREKGGVTVSLTVSNVGDATATTAQIEAGFQRRDGTVVASARTAVDRLETDSTTKTSIALPRVRGNELRARVRVFLDGSLHDAHRSSYVRKQTDG